MSRPETWWGGCSRDWAQGPKMCFKCITVNRLKGLKLKGLKLKGLNSQQIKTLKGLGPIHVPLTPLKGNFYFFDGWFSEVSFDHENLHVRCAWWCFDYGVASVRNRCLIDQTWKRKLKWPCASQRIDKWDGFRLFISVDLRHGIH